MNGEMIKEYGDCSGYGKWMPRLFGVDNDGDALVSNGYHKNNLYLYSLNGECKIAFQIEIQCELFDILFDPESNGLWVTCTNHANRGELYKLIY